MGKSGRFSAFSSKKRTPCDDVEQGAFRLLPSFYCFDPIFHAKWAGVYAHDGDQAWGKVLAHGRKANTK